MVPLMGAAQLSLFGGYAIYFPELFPTRLRSTGTSFCYNVGRYVAALGPWAQDLSPSYVFKRGQSGAVHALCGRGHVLVLPGGDRGLAGSPPRPWASRCRSRPILDLGFQILDYRRRDRRLSQTKI